MRPSRPLTVEIRGWCLLTWILTHISVMWQQLLQVHSTWMWSVWCVFNPSSGFILPYISITIPLARSSSSDLPDFSLTLGLFPFLSSLTTVGSGSRWKTWTWWEPLTGRRNPRQACVCVCVCYLSCRNHNRRPQRVSPQLKGEPVFGSLRWHHSVHLHLLHTPTLCLHPGGWRPLNRRVRREQNSTQSTTALF